MAFFNKKKKEETTCECNSTSNPQETSVDESAYPVKILGGGCAKCNQLESATKEALTQLGMETNIDHVTDFAKIATYGVMSTPALVVDGKVLSYGKVLKTDEVVTLLKKARP